MTLQVDLTRDKITKALVLFAIPIFISNIFQQLYNTADTVIIGNVLGETALAAIGASTAIYELIVGFGIGIGNGLSIVVARAYGAEDREMLKKSVAGSLIITVIVTIIIMIFSNVLLYPLLEMLNTPNDIIDEAYSYINTITLFVGIMFAYNLFAGLLRAIGNSIMPLVFLIISSIINIILDIVFIVEFNMGIKGVAVATVIAQGVSAVLCIIYIIKKCSILIPSKRHFKIDKKLYKELSGQGLSMGLMLSIVSMGTVILQSAINNLGYLIMAGHISARKIQSICIMPLMTLSLALATFVSQNKGAGKLHRIKEGVKIGNRLALIWSVIITVVLLIGAPTMIKFISGSGEAEVIENGALYLRINTLFYVVLGVLLNLRNSMQGLGEKVMPLISSIIEIVGKILFVALFIPRLGYFGIIVCEPIIWCFMCGQLVYSYYKNPILHGEEKKKSKEIVIEN